MYCTVVYNVYYNSVHVLRKINTLYTSILCVLYFMLVYSMYMYVVYCGSIQHVLWFSWDQHTTWLMLSFSPSGWDKGKGRNNSVSCLGCNYIHCTCNWLSKVSWENLNMYDTTIHCVFIMLNKTVATKGFLRHHNNREEWLESQKQVITVERKLPQSGRTET